MSTALNPLPNWAPPQSPSGPQNQNVISYNQALTQALGCDPYLGCNSNAPAIQEQNSGESLQGWINTITGGPSAPATSAPATSAPATSAPAPAATGAVGANCAWYDIACQYQANTTAATAVGPSGNTYQSNVAAAGNKPSPLSAGRIAAILLGSIFIIFGLFALTIEGALGAAESTLATHKRVTGVAGRAAAVVA